MGIFGGKKALYLKPEAIYTIRFCASRYEAKMFVYLKHALFKPSTTLGISLYTLSSPTWYSKYIVLLKC